jgi:RNA polymerase sigma factor (sigma-70 family)
MMTETTWATLRQHLAERYDEFRSRLARRLGSADRASETLHETYLRLDRAGHVGVVRSPGAFLLRIAINIAADDGRAERRRARRHDVRALLTVADEGASPETAAAARQELAALETALEELTERRRTILLWSRLEGLPLRAIAARLEISQRLVEIELKHALEHCAERLGKTRTQRFGPRPRKTS